MVVFTCNYCGDSVNKPKAEKHVNVECKRKRYGVASLCCVDCLKDFDFRTYHSHTKCMTEEERYSAPGFTPKPSSCKNERKQSSWTDTVSVLLEKPSLTKPQRSVLKSIVSYENIPRKKTKFLNFMKNSLHFKNSEDLHLLDVVFNLIETEFKSANSSAATNEKSPVKEEKPSTNATENTGDNLPVQNETESPKAKTKKPSINLSQEPESTCDDHTTVNETESSKVKEKKKNNKSRMDEESSIENAELGGEPSNNIDVPDSLVNGVVDNHNEDEGFTTVKRSKKKKKDKKDVDVPMEITETGANIENVDTNVGNSNNDASFPRDDRIVAKSRGKKKHKCRENTSVDETDDVDESSELLISANTDPTCPVEENINGKPEKKKKKRKLDQVDVEDDVDSKRSRIETTENEINAKFSWSNVVKTLLEKSKDYEMSVKRMTKRVVAEYQSFYSRGESFEDIAKKFNKKVKKLPFVVVSKDRIQLYVE